MDGGLKIMFFMMKSRGFLSTSGIQNTILKGSRGNWCRPEYSSGNQYWIRVVHVMFNISVLFIFFIWWQGYQVTGKKHTKYTKKIICFSNNFKTRHHLPPATRHLSSLLAIFHLSFF